MPSEKQAHKRLALIISFFSIRFSFHIEFNDVRLECDTGVLIFQYCFNVMAVLKNDVRWDYSGKGINSLSSPGIFPNRPSFQSNLACSIRSLELATKFHHR